MNSTHQYPLTISNSYLDVFGHVNNAVYLQLYEQARWDLLEKRGLGLSEIEREKIGPIILDLFLTFKKELKGGDHITIESMAIEMKNSKVLTLQQKMVRTSGKGSSGGSGNDELCSTLDLSLGVFDLQARKLLIPPKKWLQAFNLDLS